MCPCSNCPRNQLFVHSRSIYPHQGYVAAESENICSRETFRLPADKLIPAIRGMRWLDLVLICKRVISAKPMLHLPCRWAGK
jgi:hypothetical protein